MSDTASLKYERDDLFQVGAARVLFCGKSFIADHTGALYWPAEETMIFSDLCLDKGSYLAEDDAILPPYDTLSVFEKLEDALTRYDPARVIALGESFGGENAYRRGLSIHDIDWLIDLMDGRDWYWVSGDDDPGIPEKVGGTVCPNVSLASLRFRHEPVRAPITHEIAGGIHPVATFSQYDRVTRARCFVSNGMRMLLPSVGHYGPGTNVLDKNLDPLMGHEGLFVWVVSHGQAFPIASGQLLGEDEVEDARLM